MKDQFAFAKIKLSTPRHKNGYLYLSTIKSDEGLVSALDIRFCIDEENKFIPTKQGIRIQKANLEGCLKMFSDTEPINNFSCEVGSGRSLNLTCTEGLFGFGTKVDLRFFVENEKYSGPTKQGITINSDDFNAVCKLVNEFVKNGMSTDSYKDLFENRSITIKPKSKSSGRIQLPPDLNNILKGS